MTDHTQKLNRLAELVDMLGTAPTLAAMPRRGLEDKGVAGPTAAHFIEEVHVPYNFAYMAFTTGTTAFQNVVGVAYEEMEGRIEASHRAFSLAGIKRGAHALVTYAPLINVFAPQALRDYDLTWSFLKRSSRDALLLSLCRDKPAVIIGESSFLRATLADAVNLGFADMVPKDRIALCSGTPLDLDLLTIAERFNWRIHDLYGCQEFGWLVLDGIPLREDVALIASPHGEQYRELVVGGLPMADSFLVSESGHLCNRSGKILTYRRERTQPEYEVRVRATTLPDTAIAERTARSILRIKGRVVKVLPDCRCNAPATVLELTPGLDVNGLPHPAVCIEGPVKTRLFDTLALSVSRLGETGKTDPAWIKRR